MHSPQLTIGEPSSPFLHRQYTGGVVAFAAGLDFVFAADFAGFSFSVSSVRFAFVWGLAFEAVFAVGVLGAAAAVLVRARVLIVLFCDIVRAENKCESELLPVTHMRIT